MRDLLGRLAGEWIGEGVGQYPTIASFEFKETLRFTLDEVRPVLRYVQDTRRFDGEAGDTVPSHWETGYLHWLEADQLEWANAQLGGRVEVMTGTIDETAAGLVLRLRSTHFANDPRMAEATRVLTLEGDTLRYVMHMETTKVPHLAMHVEATLQRQ